MATVRQLSSADLSAILEIQHACPDAAQWTPGAYRPLLSGELTRPGLRGWVADCDGRIAGFLVALYAADEVEILNLAVGPSARRKGVATALLAWALEDARRGGATRAYLEVRAANATAIAFYAKSGLEPSGLRKAYYSDPSDDALILSRNL